MAKGGGQYERVFLAIACVVTVVWAFATIVQVAYPSHPVPTYANLIMATVAGSFFGGAVISGRRNGGNASRLQRAAKEAVSRGRRQRELEEEREDEA